MTLHLPVPKVGKGLIHRLDPQRWMGAPLLAAPQVQAEPIPDHRFWNDTLGWLFQGQSPSCVAHAWLHWLLAGPVTQRWVMTEYPTLDERLVLYRRLCDIAGIGNYDEGTTSDSGARWAREVGLITEWRGLETGQEVLEWVLRFGPVCIGIPWYQGMSGTSALTGRMEPSGEFEGYHEVVITRARQAKEPQVGIKNSWTRRWGKLGRGWLAVSVLDDWLRTGMADAIGAVEAHRP